MATSTSSSFLPLTTTFKPPSSCISDLWAVHSSSSGSSGTYTWMNLGPSDTAACLPSGWATSSYYSPGLCPSGYEIAANITVDIDVTVRETRATCCPVQGENTFSIRPTSTSTPPWYNYEVCQFQPGERYTTIYTFTFSTDGTTATSSGMMNNAGLINAYDVEICWQSTDFSTPPATATLSTSATVTSTSQTTTEDPSSSGLSSGAKAGVGVGVAIGGILIIAVVCTLFFARRRKQHNAGGFQGDGMAMRGVYSTAPTELAAPTAKAELSGTSARPVIAEMDGR